MKTTVTSKMQSYVDILGALMVAFMIYAYGFSDFGGELTTGMAAFGMIFWGIITLITAKILKGVLAMFTRPIDQRNAEKAEEKAE